MKIPFIKIEGLGNDYIFVEKSDLPQKPGPNHIARLVSDRRRGIGSDGLIVMERIDLQTAHMAIYNADGSQAELCGNGLRGTALYMKSVYKSKRRQFQVVTDWNQYRVLIAKNDIGSAQVRTQLGRPFFDGKAVGLREGGKSCLGKPVRLDGVKRNIYCLALPNPFAIIFVDNFNFNWQKEGVVLETSAMFKNRINVMFTKVISPHRIAVMPWERGSGATLACGTGAAAATVISTLLGCTHGAVKVMMPGGSLLTRWDIEDNQIIQEGPTKIAFSGSYFL